MDRAGSMVSIAISRMFSSAAPVVGWWFFAAWTSMNHACQGSIVRACTGFGNGSRSGFPVFGFGKLRAELKSAWLCAVLDFRKVSQFGGS